MSQNTKDSNGGKTHPVKNTGSSSKSSDKGAADRTQLHPQARTTEVRRRLRPKLDTGLAEENYQRGRIFNIGAWRSTAALNSPESADFYESTRWRCVRALLSAPEMGAIRQKFRDRAPQSAVQLPLHIFPTGLGSAPSGARLRR